jgi:hypothetical protein
MFVISCWSNGVSLPRFLMIQYSISINFYIFRPTGNPGFVASVRQFGHGRRLASGAQARVGSLRSTTGCTPTSGPGVTFRCRLRGVRVAGSAPMGTLRSHREDPGVALVVKRPGVRRTGGCVSTDCPLPGGSARPVASVALPAPFILITAVIFVPMPQISMRQGV